MVTAAVCRAAPGAQPALVAAEPDRFFVPPYLGHRGWLGYWLDTPSVDWTLVEDLVVDAYCLAAPRRLASQVRLRPPP